MHDRYTTEPAPAPDRSLVRAAQAYRSALAAGRLLEFDLDGFDRLGLPVVATVWSDDSGYDAHGVGYGTTREQAAVGALGELAERVVMRPVTDGLATRRSSYRALVSELGERQVIDPLMLILPAGSGYRPDNELVWTEVVRWRTGEPVLVPVEFVVSDSPSLPAAPPSGWLITPITNGLGAGDSVERAVGHALLEVMQRDGDTVSFKALDRGVSLDLDGFTDPGTRGLIARLRAAGIEPLVKLAADEFVPVVYATGRDLDPDASGLVLGAVGEAAHPSVEVGVQKALLEYAASRARRQFAFGPLADVARVAPEYFAAEMRQPVGEQEPRAVAAMARWVAASSDEVRAWIEPTLLLDRRRFELAALPAAPPGRWSTPQALLDLLLERLAGYDVLVRTAQREGITVAKVIVPGLEVETLSYGRIGERVFRRLLAQDSPLVGSGAPRSPQHQPIRLPDDTADRLVGWLDLDAVRQAVGPLYSLYREPRRHSVERLADAPTIAPPNGG